MDENFEATYITITDEEGNDHEVEFISRITVGEHDYAAFFPADVDEDSEEANVIIMFRIVEENGEEFLDEIEDDDEYENIAEIFMERLEDLYDFES